MLGSGLGFHYHPIRLSAKGYPEVRLESDFLPYQPRYYASGTAALAAAIIAVIQSGKTDQPEVILPAYGCPDLVSATVFAGARPVLVDMEPDRPWMDLAQLSSRISPRTVAIVAANLFGISERLDQLRPIAERAGVVLIEDSAQAFPGGGEAAIWEGDLVVLRDVLLYPERRFRDLLDSEEKIASNTLSDRIREEAWKP